MTGEATPMELSFDDNHLAPLLFGEHGRHLTRIEHQLGVSLASRGNRVTIRGPEEAQSTARTVLAGLWDRLRKGGEIDSA